MKKFLLPFLLFITLGQKVFAQFSASLTGDPIVTAGWSVGGFATPVDSTIQLTSPSGLENGYVYYSTPVNLTSCGQFTVTFDFKILVSPFSSAADGIAFWYISNPPSGFITGGGIGLPTSPNGLVMILDTYDNDGNFNNPLETLLGYNGTTAGYVEGVGTGVLAPVVPNQNFIDDGTWHHCEIDYNSGNVYVYFNYSTTPSMTGYYPLSIAGYFGFSASTGAAYSTQSVKNVHISAVGVSVPPTVTSPVYYCQGATASPLTATGATGSTFSWFTTDTATVVALPGAPTPSTSTVGTTTYYVRQGTGSCISAPDSIQVIVNPLPAAPVVSGTTTYCSGTPFIPFTVTGATGTLNWYTTGTGGIGSTTAPLAPTGVPGTYSYWVSQTVGGCAGPRDSITVKVITTPPIPTVSGTTSYCQYIGPFVPLTVASVAGDTLLWYTTATGGTGVSTEPTVNINVAGTNNYYLSQRDSGCESGRQPVPIIVHPKPAVPGVTALTYCQYGFAPALTATGTNLEWYGPGPTASYTLAPVPSTALPIVDSYYVTQTSAYGCVSDSSLLKVTVVIKPVPPTVTDTSFCQSSTPPALTADGSNLKWYTSSTSTSALPAAPVPPTTTTGPETWFVSQTVSGCESDKVPLTVDILYLPQFTITPQRAWVCQYDSITLAYTGPLLTEPGYVWTLPDGATLVGGTAVTDTSIFVAFGDPSGKRPIYLTVSDYNGRCSTTDTIRIKVVPQPFAIPFSNPEICLGDTVNLALASESDNADNFVWHIDGTLLINSSAVNITASNSNSGGPFSVSWVDSGIHIIQLNTATEEGCKSEPAYDTVNVHPAPDASFTISAKSSSICLEDSVLFIANNANYNNVYMWTPEHYFNNINKPSAWGKVEESKSIITLTVRDPFGCTASTSQEIDPGSCCKVIFPTAFTPNGDVRNNIFRPIFAGYHKFHIFQIANRWGQIIFETTNSNPSWDGTYNGTPQDMGVYYYNIQFDCGGNTIEQKGDVTLIR